MRLFGYVCVRRYILKGSVGRGVTCKLLSGLTT